jgi:hypothetical protein
MAITPGNVIVGAGYAFTAPVGTAAPADDVPANQGVNGVFNDWTAPAGWVPFGATQEGITFGIVQNSNDITIEEQSTPAQVTINSMDISVSTVLSEDTLANVKLVTGGLSSIAVTAPGTTQIGKSVLTLAEGLSAVALGFDTTNEFGFYRRVYIPKVLSVANVQAVHRRAADSRRYSVTFRAVCPVNQITITNKTAVHT